jgi:hypothetical protein
MKKRGFLPFVVGASIALSPSAYAESNWWFLNGGTATCDDAKTSPYPSPAALRAALMKTNMLKDMQVFRDKDNNVRGVQIISNSSTSIFYFTSKELCEQTKRLGTDRGFIGKPGELD